MQLPRELVYAMFSRFQVILNKMTANMGDRVVFPYTDHEKAIKLLGALDMKI